LLDGNNGTKRANSNGAVAIPPPAYEQPKRYEDRVGNQQGQGPRNHFNVPTQVLGRPSQGTPFHPPSPSGQERPRPYATANRPLTPSTLFLPDSQQPQAYQHQVISILLCQSTR
jgi:hypothetical protein